MRKTTLILGALAALNLIAVPAFAAEKTLAEIHGKSWPVSDGFAVKNQCMACHGDYAKLGAMTANLDPNPHASHLGEVNCTECHRSTAAKPELMCNTCHKFTIRTKEAR